MRYLPSIICALVLGVSFLVGYLMLPEDPASEPNLGATKRPPQAIIFETTDPAEIRAVLDAHADKDVYYLLPEDAPIHVKRMLWAATKKQGKGDGIFKEKGESDLAARVRLSEKLPSMSAEPVIEIKP